MHINAVYCFYVHQNSTQSQEKHILNTFYFFETDANTD
jgi:hypothetical protein